MSASQHGAIRKLLHEYSDGLSISRITRKLGLKEDSVRRAVQNMPDVYLDHWTPVTQGQYAAVYMAVDVPDDCPRPEKQGML